MTAILALVLAYLIGAVPFGYLLVRLKTGRDVRASGSGNIGATNVLRTTGRAAGVATLLLDIGKGYFAVWLAGNLTAHSPLWMSAAALAVMLGHGFPVFLKFKGGKAVASFVGAFLALAPLALGAVLLVFVLVVAFTRYISLGSIVAAACLPFAVWLVPRSQVSVVAAAALGGAFIVWRHKSNLRRLRAGTEHSFSFGGNRN
jgi:glycerol-3-phosphate acyltransferase PlsY